MGTLRYITPTGQNGSDFILSSISFDLKEVYHSIRIHQKRLINIYIVFVIRILLTSLHVVTNISMIIPLYISCIVCISGDITAENVRSKSLQREMDSMINDLQNVL
jgi:hypothetical protein